MTVETMTSVEALVRDGYAAYERGDWKTIMDITDPQSEWFFPGPPDVLPWAGWYRGSQLMDFFARLQCNDYKVYKAHTFFTTGDTVTVLSHQEVLVKATGKTFVDDLAAIVTIRDGKIIRFIEFSDTAAMVAAFLP